VPYSGNVTQAVGATLKVAGKTTITAPGATITNLGNVLPYYIDPAGNVTIENVGTIDLPAQTVTGNLSVTSLASGNAYGSVFSGSAINLNQSNDFGGTVSFNTKTDTYGPTSGVPGISQSGAQTVAGTSTFNAVGGTITLNDAGNAFTGAVTLNTGATGGNIIFTNNGATSLGNVTAANTANVTLESGGATTQVAGTAITAGGLELLGSGSYTLTNTGNNINTLAANTSNFIKYTDTDGFDIGTVNTVGVNTGGNNLTLEAISGTVTQSEAITASGLELLGGGSYTLDNTSNNINTLAANTSNFIKYTDTDGFTIGTVNTVGINTNNNNLTLKSNSTTDTITFTQNVTTGTGNLTVEAGTIDQTGGVITTSGTASFTATKANTGNVVAKNVNAGGTVLGTSEIGGDFTLTSTGNVTQAGGATLKVAGKTTITAPGATISNPGNVLPYYIDPAGNVTIEQVGTINLSAQTVTGNLSVTSLASGNAYGSVFSGSAINLNQSNDFGGTVSFNTKTDTYGPTSGAPGITQSGAQTVAGTSTFNAVGGTITLNDAGNAFGVAVTLNTGITGGDISLTNNGTTTLGNVTAGNTANVTLNSSGATSQVAGTAITAGGLELLGGGSYSLTNTANDVNTLTLNNTTGIVLFDDANALSISGVGTLGAVDIVAQGDITQTSDLDTIGYVYLESMTGKIDATGNNIFSSSGDIILLADTSVTTGDLLALGDIGINAGTSVTTGDLTALNNIDIIAGTSVTTGDLTALNNIDIIAGTSVNTGALDALADINITANNDSITVSGNIGFNILPDNVIFEAFNEITAKDIKALGNVYLI